MALFAVGARSMATRLGTVAIHARGQMSKSAQDKNHRQPETTRKAQHPRAKLGELRSLVWDARLGAVSEHREDACEGCGLRFLSCSFGHDQFQGRWHDGKSRWELPGPRHRVEKDLGAVDAFGVNFLPVCELTLSRQDGAFVKSTAVKDALGLAKITETNDIEEAVVENGIGCHLHAAAEVLAIGNGDEMNRGVDTVSFVSSKTRRTRLFCSEVARAVARRKLRGTAQALGGPVDELVDHTTHAKGGDVDEHARGGISSFIV